MQEGTQKMAKGQRLGGWMIRFKRCIDAEAGAAVSKKVIIKTEQSLFEAAFDKPVKAKLKRSILQGADRCEFEIESA